MNETPDDTSRLIELELLRARRELRHVQQKIRDIEAASTRLAASSAHDHAVPLWRRPPMLVVGARLVILNMTRFFNLFHLAFPADSSMPMPATNS